MWRNVLKEAGLYRYNGWVAHIGPVQCVPRVDPGPGPPASRHPALRGPVSAKCRSVSGCGVAGLALRVALAPNVRMATCRKEEGLIA